MGTVFGQELLGLFRAGPVGEFGEDLLELELEPDGPGLAGGIFDGHFESPFVGIPGVAFGGELMEEADGAPGAVDDELLVDGGVLGFAEGEGESGAGELDFVDLVGLHGAEVGGAEGLVAGEDVHVGVGVGSAVVGLEFFADDGDGAEGGLGGFGESAEDGLAAFEVLFLADEEVDAAEAVDLGVDVLVVGGGALAEGFLAGGGDDDRSCRGFSGGRRGRRRDRLRRGSVCRRPKGARGK